MIFLTGPNMAGKSTLLRALGAAVVLAHAGAAVPAASAQLSVFDVIGTVMSVEDDIRRGESYFLAEVRRVRALLRAVEEGRRTLALLDEPFRGTNVLDASDATLALLDGLAHSSRCRSVLATHLVDVVGRASAGTRIKRAHFSAEVGHSLTFDHQLRDGTSDQRLGMLLFEREGVTDLLRRVSRM